MLLNPAIAALWVACLASVVQAHGRMLFPVSRSSMWRYGYDVPPNYNDHGLNCGGYGVGSGHLFCYLTYYFLLWFYCEVYLNALFNPAEQHMNIHIQ